MAQTLLPPRALNGASRYISGGVVAAIPHQDTLFGSPVQDSSLWPPALGKQLSYDIEDTDRSLSVLTHHSLWVRVCVHN